MISDGLAASRFGLLQLMLDNFHIHLTKLRQRRSDYAFHGYGELCNLVFCLLMKTRELSSLPDIHDWDSYMDVEKVASFPVAAADEFLSHCEYEKALLAAKMSEMPKFRGRCREFIDRLAFLLVESASTRCLVSKGLCNFCPELMLEGDDKSAFDFFLNCVVFCRSVTLCLGRNPVQLLMSILRLRNEGDIAVWNVLPVRSRMCAVIC